MIFRFQVNRCEHKVEQLDFLFYTLQIYFIEAPISPFNKYLSKMHELKAMWAYFIL